MESAASAPSNADAVREDGDPRKWKILTAVVFGVFMVILDTTVVNVAFPALREAFDAPLHTAQWVLSAYVLALGVATPLAGFLGDRFGMRTTYAAGLALFTLGSLLCGVAPSLELLIAARVLQGLGGGIATPLGSAHLFRAFPPSQQGTALGLFGVALTLAPASGPLLGGWLVTHGLWRWIFFVNVPIGIVGVVLASRWLRNHKREHPPKLAWSSVALTTVGFGSMLYASTVAADHGWASPEVIGGFAVGVAALSAFTVQALRSPDPLLDVRLFGNRTFANAALIGYVSVLALFGAEFLMPLYLQLLRGLSAFEAGMTLLPMALASGITTPLAGRIYDKIGPRALLIVGYGLLAFNTWQFAHLTGDTPLSTIRWLLVVRGVALGLTVQTTFTTALGVVPPQNVGRASSLINATRFVVQAVSVALLATLLTAYLSPEMQAAAAHEGSAQVVAGGLCTKTPPPAAAAQLAEACAENLEGFDAAYMATFWASVAALLLGSMLPGWPGRWSGREGLRGTVGPGGPPPALSQA